MALSSTARQAEKTRGRKEASFPPGSWAGTTWPHMMHAVGPNPVVFPLAAMPDASFVTLEFGQSYMYPSAQFEVGCIASDVSTDLSSVSQRGRSLSMSSGGPDLKDWTEIRTPSPEPYEGMTYSSEGMAYPSCSPCSPPSAMALPATFEAAVPSRGSIGHPYQCNEACKYNSKVRGCKDGADCDRCHLCDWSRYKYRYRGMTKLQQPCAPGSPWPTQGSVGHPNSCKEACKHMRKKGVCVFQRSCRYCHFCVQGPGAIRPSDAAQLGAGGEATPTAMPR